MLSIGSNGASANWPPSSTRNRRRATLGRAPDDANCLIETMLARRHPVRRRDGVGRGRERGLIRVVVDRIVPYQQNPLPVGGVLGAVELVREASTLIMLLTSVSWPDRLHERLGYSALAFGVWDILYYVFLRVMSGWPTSLLDWDVLFLLPLPWWGPALAPVSIALLMVVWGTLVTQPGDRIAAPSFFSVQWALGALGILLALYVFMSDAIQSLPLGHEATRQVLPTSFNWPLFWLSLALMAAPVVALGWQGRLGPGVPTRPVGHLHDASNLVD